MEILPLRGSLCNTVQISVSQRILTYISRVVKQILYYEKQVAIPAKPVLTILTKLLLSFSF